MGRIKLTQLLGLLGVCCTLLCIMSSSAPAAIIFPPEPEMTWDDLLACKLVVVGRFKEHDGATLLLNVERVLRSPEGREQVKIGDAIEVKTENWWTIETGPVWFEQANLIKPDQLRLCHKLQIVNPGPPLPEVVLEAGEPAIFFFPERRASLRRAMQVLPAVQAGGWQQALDHKPMDVLFRLGQGFNKDLEQEAIKELQKSRNPKAIDFLVDALLNEVTGNYRVQIFFLRSSPQQLLLSVGDKEGDLYDPLKKKLAAITKDQKVPWGLYRATEIMGAVDATRAFKDMREWIKDADAPIELRRAAVNGLAWVGTEESLDAAIGLLDDRHLGDAAHYAIRQMVGERSWPYPPIPPAPRLRLFQHAKAKLTGAPFPANLSESVDVDHAYMLKNILEKDSPPE